MLDFNTYDLSDRITGLIDHALQQRNAKQVPREYLGASRLGVSCTRALQYEYFKTAKDPGRDFSGRILRIFEAGHVFEDLMVRWLREVGFTLLSEDHHGEQYGFSELDGKLQGHIDGVITAAPEVLGFEFPILFECKSLNNKSWKDTKRKGVTISKPVYAGQVSLYQAYMEPQFPGISTQPALFTAINKDTAELYFEAVPFNGELAQSTSDKGVRVIDACEAKLSLPRISKDPSHFECKMCEWRERCWEIVPEKEINDQGCGYE